MPFGPAKSWTEYNGKSFTRSFDQDYRITSLALGTLNTQSLTWDNASRLTGLTETSLSNKSLRLRQYGPPDEPDHRHGEPDQLDL